VNKIKERELYMPKLIEWDDAVPISVEDRDTMIQKCVDFLQITGANRRSYFTGDALVAVHVEEGGVIRVYDCKVLRTNVFTSPSR
jgi:hypothetical protein